jgi:hypothetical protein
MALVMGTVLTLGVSLIVAVSMKDAFVTQFFPSAETSGRNVIDFYYVLITEEQSTPLTFPLLFAQQDSQRSTPHVVVAEPLTPVQQVSVVGASSSLHFDVSLDLRMAMIP